MPLLIEEIVSHIDVVLPHSAYQGNDSVYWATSSSGKFTRKSILRLLTKVNGALLVLYGKGMELGGTSEN